MVASRRAAGVAAETSTALSPSRHFAPHEFGSAPRWLWGGRHPSLAPRQSGRGIVARRHPQGWAWCVVGPRVVTQVMHVPHRGQVARSAVTSPAPVVDAACTGATRRRSPSRSWSSYRGRQGSFPTVRGSWSGRWWEWGVRGGTWLFDGVVLLRVVECWHGAGETTLQFGSDAAVLNCSSRSSACGPGAINHHKEINSFIEIIIYVGVSGPNTDNSAARNNRTRNGWSPT